MDKDILECVLKRDWKKTKLEKLVSIESVPAVGKNINFLSAVNRLNLKVILGNGRTANRSLIVKISTGSEFESEINSKYRIFETETKMYIMLKQIEYLMEEFEDTEDVLWCQMIHHIPYTCIVLEDMKAEGFHMADRNKFYDLEHIILAVHSLGRYHGLCKVLEERGLLSKQDFKPWYFFSYKKMHEYIYWDLIALARGVKKFWNPSWTPIVEKINISKISVTETVEKLGELDETKFNVANHGDCQKNNIVVKYSWDKKPIALRFLDFQLSHYGSSCIDLTYMLYLAAKPSVRRDNYDLLLRTYHNSLIDTLDKFQFKGNRPEIEEIINGMEKYSYLGLFFALTWYPSLLRSEKIEELRDFEKIEATDGKEGYSDELFDPQVLEEDIGPDLKGFVNKFCVNS